MVASAVVTMMLLVPAVVVAAVPVSFVSFLFLDDNDFAGVRG
jgi:hypothetical protein